MKNKKIPMRSCAVTREKLPKGELLRVVRTPDGEILVDLGGKMNGRGAYIKKDLSVIEKARKSKALSKVLEIDVPEYVFDELVKIVGGN